MVYKQKKLFKDSQLIGNLDYFMNIFVPYDELKNIESEKGSFSLASTNFDENSI